MPLTLLITGFGRFPGAPRNPSAALAAHVAHLRHPALAGTRRVLHVFETSYAAVEEELPRLIARHEPDVLLMFGLAARTRHVRIETAARNAVSSIFPDARRSKPRAGAITHAAPSRRRGRAPFPALVLAARTAGVAAHPSRDAGRYVCNYLYWRALEAAGSHAACVVFVHIPATRSQPCPRGRIRRTRPALADLVRAGTAILLALTAAARRPPFVSSGNLRRADREQMSGAAIPR